MFLCEIHNTKNMNLEQITKTTKNSCYLWTGYHASLIKEAFYVSFGCSGSVASYYVLLEGGITLQLNKLQILFTQEYFISLTDIGLMVFEKKLQMQK